MSLPITWFSFSQKRNTDSKRQPVYSQFDSLSTNAKTNNLNRLLPTRILYKVCVGNGHQICWNPPEFARQMETCVFLFLRSKEAPFIVFTCYIQTTIKLSLQKMIIKHSSIKCCILRIFLFFTNRWRYLL